MATAYAHVLSDTSSGSGQTSRTTTATYTPTTDALQRCVVGTFGGSMPSAPTLSGAGLTWVLVDAFRMFNQNNRGVFTFRALGTGSAGALTFTAGGADTFDNCYIVVDEVTGVDTSGANGSGAVVQTVVQNSQETLTPSVSITMTPGNEGFAAFPLHDTSRTATPRTNWTELGDVQLSGSLSVNTQYRQATDTAASCTWSGTGTPVTAAICWEIKPASGGTPTGQPTMRRWGGVPHMLPIGRRGW